MLIIDIIIGMLIVSGISMACLGLYGRRFTDRIPAAVPYILIMFLAAIWTVLYALEILTVSLPQKILFHNLRFLVLPFFPVLELWLVIAFVKKNEWLRKDWAAAVLIIPVAAAILAITSQFHTLLRYNFSLNTSGPIPVLQYSESTFYTLYIFYSLILLVIAIIILIIESRKRGSLWTAQTILLLLALAFPTVINYLFVFGLTPVPGVNMTAPLLWVAALLYTIALFRYRFLNIIPIARSRLIESMRNPMIVLEMGGQIIDLNPTACSLFFTTTSAAVGKPVNEVASDWSDFLSLCQSEKATRRDLIRYQNGNVRFYSGSVELILTRSGEAEARLILLSDMTEHKHMEEALRESDEKIRLLLNSTAEAIYGLDMNGNCTFCNSACLHLLGYTHPDELLGRNMHWQIHAKHPDGTHFPVEECRIFQAFHKGEGTHVDDEVLWRSDGTSFPAEYWSYPQRRDGTVVGAVVTFLDITERKQAEEALLRANKQLNLLSSITRHDILNQLMALKGYLYLSNEMIDNPAILAGYIKKEEQAANAIERQITFTRDYQELGAAAPAWQNVNASIQKAVAGLPMRDVRVDVDPKAPDIFADPLFEKVFYNLIDNALRYGGDRMKTIRVSSEESDLRLTLVCEDDGVGISAEDKKHLFLRGFGKNTGLGLFLSREILSITGITITETGEPGKGARFEITVPKGSYRVKSEVEV